MQIRVPLAAAALLMCADFSAGAQPILNPNQVWGPATDGLRAAMSAVTGGNLSMEAPELYVALENIGSTDVVLILGAMLGAGKTQIPSRVSLILTDSKGDSKELPFIDVHAFPGRIDPLLVALPAGACYLLRLNVKRFLMAEDGFSNFRLNPGHYQVTARFVGGELGMTNLDTQGLKVWNFWKGTVESNKLAFEVARSAAKQ